MTDADYKADEEGGTETAAADGVVSEGPPHHSFHLGVNDVATLVLEDNLGNTYDFYTFQVMHDIANNVSCNPREREDQ